MVLFEKCCFCIPLKRGCLILGYINLIATIIALLLSIYSIVLGVQATHSPKPELVDVGYLIIGITVVLTIFLVLALAFSIVLIVGINKNKPGHVKAYLIYNLIFLIIFAIVLILKIIKGMGGIIDGIVQLVLSIYFLLVVKSYYTKMQEEKAALQSQKV